MSHYPHVHSMFILKCALKLVLKNILYYDARSEKHQIRKFKSGGLRERHVVASWKRGNHLTPGKDPVRIIQEAGWAPGPVWIGAKNLIPTGIRSPDLSARSESLYRLSYPGPLVCRCFRKIAKSGCY